MTNPSPRNAKERAARREEHSADTYYRRQILEPEEQGRHAKASTVVGASMPYPATVPGSPWNDATAVVLNRTPDVTGVDTLAAPVVGSPAEIEEAALLKQIARASYEMKTAPVDDHERLDALQERIDAAQRELDRRRSAGKG